MYTFHVDALRAALTHAAKNSDRKDLESVHFDAKASCLVSTDGHRLLVIHAPQSVTGESVTMPRSLVEAALASIRGKKPKPTTLDATVDGATITLGSVKGDAIAEYVDYRKVIPRSTTGDPAHFNPHYVADALAAIQLATGTKNNVLRVAYNGQRASVFGCAGVNSVFVLIMPLDAAQVINETMGEPIMEVAHASSVDPSEVAA